MHATKTGTPSSKRAPTAQQLQSSYNNNNNNNSDSNDAYIINNMNNNSNINLPPECSSLLESPTPYYYDRNNRQYEWALNSPPQQQYQGHHQQQQQQLKQPPPLPFAAAMVSPPTPDKPSAWKTTLEHANTATAQANQYYTQPQQQQHQHHHQQQYNQQHVKKRVHFARTAKVHPIDSLPKASDMSPKEKATIWYLENDYNKFKHDAASDGGVKIIRRVSVEAERMKKSCAHYVLIGSFDGDADTAAAEDRKSSSISNNNDGSNHSSDAATAGSNRSSPSGKFYNEHEYNDYIKANGQMVCKRGLGYHFSRIRKRNRAMTRSAVLAWQKSMEKEVNKKRIEQLVHRKMQANSSGMHKSLPTCSSNIHSQVVIALVSSKCSRVSREEALWRGNVDFRVAYPERRYLNNLYQPEENMTMQSSLFHQHGGFNVDYNIQKKRSSSISGGDLVLDDDLYHSTKKRRSNVYDSSTTSAAAGYAEV